MIHRTLTGPLMALAKQYPAITLTGPRQAGKTTLVKHCFPDKPYLNLEDLNLREIAKTDPAGFLNAYSEGCILDEVQNVPELLSHVQVLCDQSQENGRYILTGSHQFSLHQAITQSLAGRTAMLYLLPLSMAELEGTVGNCSIEQWLLQGGLPRIFSANQDPTQTYRNYLKTYIERDLRQLINLHNMEAFQTFIRLCAARVGQLVNFTSLASEVGISHTTIRKWLSLLEASFIIFRLPPFYRNINKQLTKSPKLYFTDVGLLCYLLHIESIEHLQSHPLKGNIFENLVVLELFKARFNQAKDPHFYFYRDKGQHEVDVLYQMGDQCLPIEIKSSQTFKKQHLKGLEYFQSLFPEQAKTGYLVYAGEHEQSLHNIQLIHFTHSAKILTQTN